MEKSSTQKSKHIELNRKFWSIEADTDNDPESIQIMFAFGVNKELSWKDLLKKDRVVILAEAGAGKTEEFRAVTRKLRTARKSAFFCRIELLQTLDIRNSLDIGTSEEFDEWINGDKEAYFFLDSVDEARLHSHSAFEIALRHFAQAISQNINRAKIFVSCRVSNWLATADRSMFLRLLPIPINPTMRAEGKIIEEAVDNSIEKLISVDQSDDAEEKEEEIVFQLAPLDDNQIRHFASRKGVVETNVFMDAVYRADAGIFAERPQDLLELINYWKANNKLGRHIEMLEFNIKVKLNEHDPKRDEKQPLSGQDASIGVELLASALTFQKKNTIILPDWPVGDDLRAISIDSKEVLTDWPSDKIQTILGRPIFDEAIYGTVRFHHRTVREYLTAKWLKRLIDEGKSRRSIEGLLFAERYGREVVIPSMRPIAAWLALWDDRVRLHLKRIAPEILIENGDPSAMPVEFRKALLIGFAELYADHKDTGESFDITMVRRLADPRLASVINSLLEKYATHDDVCALLLKLVWQGRISESADAVLAFAMANQANSYVRTCAIRAVAAAGAPEHHVKLVDTLLAGLSELSSREMSEICTSFFPAALSVPQLLEILQTAKPLKRYSTSPLQQSVKEIADAAISDSIAQELLRGLHRLIKKPPFIEERHCEISAKYTWLLPGAIKLSNRFIRNRDAFSFSAIVFDIFLGFFAAQKFRQVYIYEPDVLLKDAKNWPEFGYRLFWHAVASARNRVKDKQNHFMIMWRARSDMGEFWKPDENDLERLFQDLNHKPLMEDRFIALNRIIEVYGNAKRPRKLRERMKRAVSGTPELENELHGFFHPKPLSEQEKKDRRHDRYYKRKQKERKKREQANRLEWRQVLRQNPQEVSDVGNAQKGEIWKRTTYLYDRIREQKADNEHGYGLANWRALIDEFGVDVAKNFRDGCIAYWREFDPFKDSSRRTNKSFTWPRIIGLTGLAMEAADDLDWAKKITPEEARIAAHYSVSELNGFPGWLNTLCDAYPDTVDEVIEDQLRWEFHESSKENFFARTLSSLRYGDKKFSLRYQILLFDLLSENEPYSDRMLDNTLLLILGSPLSEIFKKEMIERACKRFATETDIPRQLTWLVVLFGVDGVRGLELLKKQLEALPSEEERKEWMINFCTTLINHQVYRFGLANRDFERIEVLGELEPLVYHFIKVEEDNHYEGAFTPNARDQAAETRSHLLSVICNTPGRSSYDLLIKLSKTVSNRNSRDRMAYLAKERASRDAEFEPWSGRDVAEFALSADKQPQTEAELFRLALARIDDLKIDIEEGDDSEAALLLKLTKETEIRTVFANRLKKSSHSRYTVGSEEELADAKRTDIRLHAPLVSAPVPIELKIADNNWTHTTLLERLENQLIGQYMRVSRYGIFLLVHNGSKKRWKNLHTNKMIFFAELVEALKQDALALIQNHTHVEALEVVGVDYTLR